VAVVVGVVVVVLVVEVVGVLAVDFGVVDAFGIGVVTNFGQFLEVDWLVQVVATLTLGLFECEFTIKNAPPIIITINTISEITLGQDSLLLTPSSI
jgi:hypothetical protein